MVVIIYRFLQKQIYYVSSIILRSFIVLFKFTLFSYEMVSNISLVLQPIVYRDFGFQLVSFMWFVDYNNITKFKVNYDIEILTHLNQSFHLVDVAHITPSNRLKYISQKPNFGVSAG